MGAGRGRQVLGSAQNPEQAVFCLFLVVSAGAVSANRHTLTLFAPPPPRQVPILWTNGWGKRRRRCAVEPGVSPNSEALRSQRSVHECVCNLQDKVRGKVVGTPSHLSATTLPFKPQPSLSPSLSLALGPRPCPSPSLLLKCSVHPVLTSTTLHERQVLKRSFSEGEGMAAPLIRDTWAVSPGPRLGLGLGLRLVRSSGSGVQVQQLPQICCCNWKKCRNGRISRMCDAKL